MRIEVVGIKELQKSIEKIGQVPAKHARAAALKGMKPPLQTARKDAPHETGALRKGIKLKGERSRMSRYGKKVYSIVFDRAMNDVFQTKNAEGKVVGYYPTSQEYGWVTQSGNAIPGQLFITNAYNTEQETIEKTITDELAKRLEGEINKGGLKP